jgi:transposase
MNEIIQTNFESQKEIFKVFDIGKNTFFFIQVKNQVEIFREKIMFDIIIPNNNHIKILKEEVNLISLEINNEEDLNEISITTKFYNSLSSLNEISKENSVYAKNIKEILMDYHGEKIISLKYIQLQYLSKFKQHLSLMTISRILRYHLKMHFRKTILKNPKLCQENYLIMEYCFLIGIIKAIENKLNLIFLDESGFKINGNNLYMWVKDKDSIYGGAKKDIKKRINLILGINKSEIILGHYYNNETIGSNEFLIFIKEIIQIIGKEGINTSIFILDNASYHLSKEIKEFAKLNKLKFLFNCPYRSEFNAIEIVFNLIKSNVHKEIYKKQKEFKERIDFFINDPDVNNSIKKVYKKTIENYIDFYETNAGKIKEITFEKKKRKKKK